MELNDEQQRAVTAPLGDIAVMAGAGSGKTRVIVQRIEHMIREYQVSGYKIVAFTYTRRAAREMRSRLKAGANPRETRKVWVGTIHAWAMEQLFRFGEYRGWRPNTLTVLGDRDAKDMLRWTLEDMGLYRGGKCVKGLKMSDVKRAFDEYYTLGKAPPDEQQALILTNFRNACLESNALTYGMILFEALALLQDKAVLPFLQHDYQHVILDEMQDTTPLQWEVIKTLRPLSRFLVGDLRQNIFSFAGVNTIRTEQEFSRANVQLSLSTNFRSVPDIVALGNRSLPLFQAICAARGAQEDSIKVVHSGSSDIVALVQRIMSEQGLAFEDIAILCRVHRPLAKSVEALQSAGMPVHYPHAAESLDVHPDMLILHAYLSLTVNPEDMFAFRRLAEYLKIPPTIAQEIRSNAAIQQIPVLHAWNIVLGRPCETPPVIPWGTFCAEVEGRIFEHLAVEELTAVSAATYLKWSAGKDLQGGLEAPPEGHITALSVHQAKGLEFKAVILIGLSEGILPSSMARTPEDLEEEQRVFYVGVTRAQDVLVLSPRHDAPVSRFLECNEGA